LGLKKRRNDGLPEKPPKLPKLLKRKLLNGDRLLGKLGKLGKQISNEKRKSKVRKIGRRGSSTRTMRTMRRIRRIRLAQSVLALPHSENELISWSQGL
jgi:hypothetical protein